MWNIGDKVKWGSQAEGSEKEKRGTVHAIVPAGSYARRYLPEGLAQSQKKFDTNHAEYTRYIIAVPRGGKSRKVDYYCPRANQLQVDDSPESEGNRT
ncbi:hypothetical protein [Paenibacillus tyrfis]|uniref:Hypervirulence associated protein TUDOR domain-containing protein n=1 Tax=Paenibacillus tyrfis TaxID=1501230 RepID=A0A081PAR6_9BACL|nr:hypothetical protein [Paenibacillus tyrfis]KEQ27789.1 hypothetical protein ET33_14055 [Paenibacillus tyrfis]